MIFLLTIDKNVACDICHYEKHNILPFPLSNHTTTYERLHLIYGALCLFHYFMVTSISLPQLDDHNRFTLIILCQSKSEVSVLVQRFILMIEKQHDCKVKTTKTYNGPDFLMHELYAYKGLEHQTSCVETPKKREG